MRSTAPRIAWFTLVGALLVLAYSYMGYVMVGSFTVSDPLPPANYRTAAWVYLGLTATALVIAIGAAVYLLRVSGRQRP